MNKFKYEEKPKNKLKADYSRREKDNLNAFSNFNDFYDWYKKEQKVCYYCGLTEEESQRLVMTGLLTSNRFPQNGVLGRGQSRGVWLEVDRWDPKGNYSKENCRLCCYFCNNDKSDVFFGDDYKSFMKNRVEFLRQLLLKKQPDNR